MTNIHGGCLCGNVRYAITAEPVFSGVCHCKDCQKSSGSAFGVIVAVPNGGFSASGALKSYIGRGDSGKEIRRRFCPECGSSIAVEADALPGVVMVQGGTLDDPSAVKPGMHVYCKSKLDWMVIPEGVGAFPQMPPAG